jgi:hypothetical protein
MFLFLCTVSSMDTPYVCPLIFSPWFILVNPWQTILPHCWWQLWVFKRTKNFKTKVRKTSRKSSELIWAPALFNIIVKSFVFILRSSETNFFSTEVVTLHGSSNSTSFFILPTHCGETLHTGAISYAFIEAFHYITSIPHFFLDSYILYPSSLIMIVFIKL